MKTLVLGIALLISVSVSGQTIKIEGKNYKVSCVNPDFFEFNGFWKIIGRETYSDDGTIIDSLNHNKNGVGDYINFNYQSKYFYAFTTIDVVNLIVKPVYKKRYYSRNELQDWRLNSHKDSLLVIDIYRKNGKEPFLSSAVINKDLMVLFFDGNSSTFIERVGKSSENLGWNEVDGYNSMSGSFGYQKIVLPENILKNKQGVLDFIFTPQKSCNETSLIIKNQLSEDVEGVPLREKSLFTNNNLFVNPIQGSIPLKDLETNIIRVIKGACEGKEEWNFKWKIDNQSGTKENRGINYNDNFDYKNRIAQVRFNAHIKNNISLTTSSEIASTSTIISQSSNSTANVNYHAKSSILLHPTSEFNQGSVFTAKIVEEASIPQLKLLRANIYGFNGSNLEGSNLVFSFTLDSLDKGNGSIVFFHSESIKRLASGQYLVIGKYTVNNNSLTTNLYLSTFPSENSFKEYVEIFRLSGKLEICKFPALGFRDTAIEIDMNGALKDFK